MIDVESNFFSKKIEKRVPNLHQVNIAYFILVHRFPEQFKRLFKAIYDSDNHYLIHLDKKMDAHLHDELVTFLKDYPFTYILESENINWGGYSMVQAELNGMKFLLNHRLKWDYFINLSGQDFPLKSQNIIRNFLTINNGSNYIKIANQIKIRPETLNRIENYFQENENGFVGRPFKRTYMTNVVPYIGGQWMILTRECCDFICNSGEAETFEKYYINTLIADESFFQTVLMNSSFNGKIINDDKRAIIWIPDGDIKLRPKTFTKKDINFLLSSDNLFARKFDDDVDSSIIDLIHSNIHSPLKNTASENKKLELSF
ncbi:MAG: hypothetical protein RLZZ546_1329 [Bacteroidota bacterium]|jgi:hypothetical protein